MSGGDFSSSLEGLTVAELVDKKGSVEHEIKQFSDVLETQQRVGMKESLVDSEGYPRSDIDVYSVRIARNQIICLQNDHKMIMSAIEQKLHKLHEASRQGNHSLESSLIGVPLPSPEMEGRRGFARVGTVTRGSPAAAAGLAEDDVIMEFGSVKASTFNNLQDIARVVQHSQGQAVRVQVTRGNRSVVLSLTPQPWSGHGLLGCQIVPQ